MIKLIVTNLLTTIIKQLQYIQTVGSKNTMVSLDPIVQVAIERGKRLAPFRTQKLSLPSLIILHLSGVETQVAAQFSDNQSHFKLPKHFIYITNFISIKLTLLNNFITYNYKSLYFLSKAFSLQTCLFWWSGTQLYFLNASLKVNQCPSAGGLELLLFTALIIC